MAIPRRVVRGVASLGALALVAALAVVAAAQPAPVPVHIVQGQGGTLYVVQGSTSWTLVPGQISPDDEAALNPSGEIDEVLPDPLFVVQPAPTPPPSATQPPAPTPVPTGCASPISGTINLTGKAASDLPGTCIALGAMISSTLDRGTKPSDVFAIDLTAGATYQFFFSSANNYGRCGPIQGTIINPNQGVARTANVPGQINALSPFSPAASGTYYLKFDAFCSGQQYTFSVKQS